MKIQVSFKTYPSNQTNMKCKHSNFSFHHKCGLSYEEESNDLDKIDAISCWVYVEGLTYDMERTCKDFKVIGNVFINLNVNR
jgi:hypothetical protein